MRLRVNDMTGARGSASHYCGVRIDVVVCWKTVTGSARAKHYGTPVPAPIELGGDDAGGTVMERDTLLGKPPWFGTCRGW